MSSLARVIAALDRIDWNFPSTGTDARGVHALHAFPGNFIPQIPSSLIQILSAPGELVLDPFCGSGTTGIEALKLGRSSICSDLLSSSIFVMQGKRSAYISPPPRYAVSELMSELTWNHLCESDRCGEDGEGVNPLLEGWYDARTLRQLKYIWRLIEQRPPNIRNVFELLFSEVLFLCASTQRSKTSSGLARKHHWGWVADNVRPILKLEHDAVGDFRMRLVRLLELPDRNLDREQSAACQIVRQDARYLAVKSACVDLVVTSPPYVAVIDYARANRLLYLWKNWDMDHEKAQETGARFKRGRKELLAEYLGDMDASWREISRVLKPGGFCAVVIGESRRFPGAAKETLGLLSRLLNPIWGPINRTPSRRRVMGRFAAESVEYIFVCQKS